MGAGTVEFLYDAGQFYFMEMNTRLQVEHTVTEAITGLDLVEWQLRVAAGERLPLTQEQIRFSGHAIEARVCAEDPQRGFLPSAGELALLKWPEAEHVRVDAGFVTGDRVPETYDSLLGKVIAWAETRAEAAARLAAALDATYCAGVHSNEHWLARVLRDRALPERAAQHRLPGYGRRAVRARAAARPERWCWRRSRSCCRAAAARRRPSPWAHTGRLHPESAGAQVTLRFSAEAHSHQVELQFQDGRAGGRARGWRRCAGPARGQPPRPTPGGAPGRAARCSARLFSSAARVHLWTPTEHVELALDDPRTQQFEASAATGGLTTPLPGVVVSVPVKVGDAVEAGAVVMLIEAMKMEHAITAPHAGTVTAIHFAPGERVSEGSPLLEMARARLKARARAVISSAAAALASARALAISLSVFASSSVKVSPRATYLPATAMVGMPVIW